MAFWGLTRSLKHTMNSINECVLNKLKENNIEYKIFMHTWIINSPYTNNHANETNIMLDNEEYKLLNPDYLERHNQDEFKKNINFNCFRSHPDPWKTNYAAVDNFICAMFSKLRCTELIEKSGEKFDYIIFMRPDVQYITDFHPKFFKFINSKSICVPNFAIKHSKHKFNDRFCICNMNTYKIYGKVFKKMYEYSKKLPLHSENFHGYIMHKNKINVKFIPFIFHRVRADGSIYKG